MTLRHRHIQARRGVTLLEVIFAMVIFLGSFVALNHLVTVSTDNAVHVQQQGQALMLCESKLAEVCSGITALESNETYSNFSSQDWANLDETWQWKMTAQQDGEIAGLYAVQVWVQRDLGSKKLEVTLSQLVLDPTIRGSTADVAGVSTNPDASSGSTDPNSSGSGTNTNQSGAAATPATGAAAATPKTGGATGTPATGGTTGTPATGAPKTGAGTPAATTPGTGTKTGGTTKGGM
jgi:hypothetical protein